MTRPTRRSAWRVWGVVTAVAAGALFATSALDSGGQDLRATSVTDLSTLVLQTKAQADDLQHQLGTVSHEVSTLGATVHTESTRRLQARIARLRDPAGLQPLSGPGVQVTLDDAPRSELDHALQTGDPPVVALLVHQQDIQSVVNALWVGGARGVTVQNQRIISTTGVRCVGNVVILHGVPYSPPYVIRAVGDPATLQHALDHSSYISAYRQIAAVYGLGYDVQQPPSLSLPGYTGTLRLQYARPLAVSPTTGSGRAG